MERKLLQHDEFGLCVLLPKPHWRAAGEPGETLSVLVDGQPLTVEVVGEDCDCRGVGWHEHRFLRMPAAAELTPGRRVVVEIAGG